MAQLVKRADVHLTPLKEAAPVACKQCGKPVYLDGLVVTMGQYAESCSAACRLRYTPAPDKNEALRERVAARLRPRLIVGKARPAR
jgi:hypothetical protein